jgi:acetoin utilization deacetylase AcuC-like enzyme
LDLVVFDHPSFARHRSPREHPERPERAEAARRAVASLGVARVEQLDAPRVAREDAIRAHAVAHVDLVEQLGEEHRDLDPDTYAGPGTRDAALHAAGGAAALGRALAGGARRGLAIARPPGHHAEHDRAMGFCILNNVAIAARTAIDRGARRVAIVDWDAHHGNGTQQIFEGDEAVLFVSLHQWPLYPGSGAPDEIGSGAGAGKTVNLAMPPGSGLGEYGRAFSRVVLPVLEEHRPDVILVSAGFDAHARDPLAELALEEAGFAALSSELASLADRLDVGLGLVLEGGYDLEALERSLAATLDRALRPQRTALPELRCSAAAERAIAMTARSLAPHWSSLRSRG